MCGKWADTAASMAVRERELNAFSKSSLTRTRFVRGLRDLRSRLHSTLTAQSADSFHCAVHRFSSSARLEAKRARLSSFKHSLPDVGKQRYFRYNTQPWNFYSSNTSSMFLAPLRCSAELRAALNWLESLLVTRYRVTNKKRVPINEFRENEQKTALPTQNKVKSALPDMSSCLCFTLKADNSSAHHVSTGKLEGSHISHESGLRR